MEPLVSIITVNYRQPKLTCLLLDSIKQNTYPNLEVIIVDNAPLSDSTFLFKNHYPQAKIIISQENLGFAAGNNLGIRASNGKYLFLVNNDTVFTERLIEDLLSRFDKETTTGVVGPKIYYQDRPNIIQFAGFTKVNIVGRNRFIGEGEEDKGQYEEAKEMPYIHGAAMMVKRNVIKEVGEMPTLYFLYYEELDWCTQIRKAGYKIIFEPKAVLYHRGSASIKIQSPQRIFYLNRSRILFMRRQSSKGVFLLFVVFFLFFSLPKWTFYYVAKKQFYHLKAFYQAIGWHLNNGKI